jgi:hypothetical protein
MGDHVSAGGDKTGIHPAEADARIEDLRQEVQRLRELVDVAEAAIGTMRARCDEAASAVTALRDRCDDAEEAKAHLARMAVASARLHESAVEAESLRNLQDVLVNLIGTEEIAVWSLSSDGRAFELRASQGIDPESWQRVSVDDGLLGKAMARGEIVMADETGMTRPTVCVPLFIGRRIVGMVAVFRLLPHRGRLGPQDDDVFRLVSEQAAFALFCSGEPWAARREAGNG